MTVNGNNDAYNNVHMDPRYSRQINLPEIGQAGQLVLAQKRVLAVGAGGLGSPLLFALAGAGIGHITIADQDMVSESNLNRQFLYRSDDIGKPKANLAAERLLEYHPDLRIEAISESFNDINGPELIASHDLVIAAVDNRRSRLLMNQLCCRYGRILIDGGVSGFSGYAAVIEPGITPCYHCLFGINENLPSKTSGVLGSVAGVIGSLEATLAVMLLLGMGNPLAGEVLYFHAVKMTFERLKMERNPDCPHCADLWEKSKQRNEEEESAK